MLKDICHGILYTHPRQDHAVRDCDVDPRAFSERSIARAGSAVPKTYVSALAASEVPNVVAAGTVPNTRSNGHSSDSTMVVAYYL